MPAFALALFASVASSAVALHVGAREAPEPASMSDAAQVGRQLFGDLFREEDDFLDEEEGDRPIDMSRRETDVRPPAGKLLVHVHIAKTAGASFRRAMNRYLHRDHTLNSKQSCLPTMARTQMYDGDHFAFLLRNPVSHVYSQYIDCRDSRWGRDRIQHWKRNNPVKQNKIRRQM